MVELLRSCCEVYVSLLGFARMPPELRSTIPLDCDCPTGEFSRRVVILLSLGFLLQAAHRWFVIRLDRHRVVTEPLEVVNNTGPMHMCEFFPRGDAREEETRQDVPLDLHGKSLCISLSSEESVVHNHMRDLVFWRRSPLPVGSVSSPARHTMGAPRSERNMTEGVPL